MALDGIKRPIQALSGVEKTAFDVAFVLVLGAGIHQGPGVPTVLLVG